MTRLCIKCGTSMDLLLTSWYCSFCDDPKNRDKTQAYGYIQVSNYWLQLHGSRMNPLIAPKGTVIYIYKTEEDIKEVLWDNHTIGVINITYEPDIKFSDKWMNVDHVCSRDLPFSVLNDKN